jgi:type VI protein secretion system component Hcp
MSEKVYVKIDGITGPVQVEGFTGCFEAHAVDGGTVTNNFSATNNGMSYAGVPVVNDLVVSLKNCSGEVSSALHNMVLKATPLKEIAVSQISRLQGKDTETHGTKHENAHIKGFHHDPDTRDASLHLGNFSSVETAHYTIKEDGSLTPLRVNYDLTKEAVS